MSSRETRSSWCLVERSVERKIAAASIEASEAYVYDVGSNAPHVWRAFTSCFTMPRTKNILRSVVGNVVQIVLSLESDFSMLEDSLSRIRRACNYRSSISFQWHVFVYRLPISSCQYPTRTISSGLVDSLDTGITCNVIRRRYI